MSDSVLKVIGWSNLADEANADMQARIDNLSRRASWDNIPTWDDLNNSPAMWVMHVRASWAAFGATEESIVAEAQRLYSESKGNK